MPDEQPTHPLERAREIERDILYLLTDPEDNQPLWSVEDLVRETDERDVLQYLGSLHRAGLIHRTSEGYVFASRAAVCHIQMVGHGVV
jgi:hypothetical protein